MDLYAIANRFRAALARRDAQAARRLVEAYGIAYLRISRELQDLISAIDSARARGEIVDASWLLREQRLSVLEKQVRVEMDKFGREATGLIKTEQSRAVRIGAAEASDLVRVAVGRGQVSAAVNRLPTEAVEQMIGFLEEQSPLRDLVSRFGAGAAEKIRDELIAGVALGSGPSRIAGRMREVLGGNLTRALAIARTETGRAYTSAAQATYLENADVLAGWVWISARTTRTCALCWAMHGTVHPLEEPFGSHVNCRCATAPVTHDQLEARPDGSAAVRGVEPGAQAFAGLSADEQRAILGPGKLDALRRGEIELVDLVDHRLDPRWGHVRTQRSLALARQSHTDSSQSNIYPMGTVSAGPPAGPTGQAVGSFSSIAEAEQWAQKAYPKISWDLAGAHIDTINPTLKQFDLLARDYPDVVERLQYVGTYQTASKLPAGKTGLGFGREVAHAYKDGTTMGLNPAYYGDPGRLRQALQRSEASGFYPPGCKEFECIITHEFGHLVDGWLKATRKGFLEVASADGFGIVGDTITLFHGEQKRAKKASSYGRTNSAEAFAEAFNSIYHSPSDKWVPYTKKLEKFLDFIRAAQLRDLADVKFVQQLQGDARSAAIQLITELKRKLGFKV